MKIIDFPSPHFNDRPDGVIPSLIVLHFTAADAARSLSLLTRPRPDGTKVSAHYLVREDGQVLRLVAEEKRAWHAGVSLWRGEEDVNSRSIGIEIVNDGHSPYPPAQIAAVTALCQDIQKRRPAITPDNIIGHADVAPGRKVDPGFHFPWKALAKRGIGASPRPRLADHFNARAVTRDPAKLERLLEQAGYGTANVENSLAAFQQHFVPRVYTHPRRGEKPGQPSRRTVARLKAVARHIARSNRKRDPS